MRDVGARADQAAGVRPRKGEAWVSEKGLPRICRDPLIDHPGSPETDGVLCPCGRGQAPTGRSTPTCALATCRDGSRWSRSTVGPAALSW